MRIGLQMPLTMLALITNFIIDKEVVIQQIEQGGVAAEPASAQQACSVIGHRSDK